MTEAILVRSPLSRLSLGVPLTGQQDKTFPLPIIAWSVLPTVCFVLSFLFYKRNYKENDRTSQLTSTRSILQEKLHVTSGLDESRFCRYIARLISRRSVRLYACGIGALLQKRWMQPLPCGSRWIRILQVSTFPGTSNEGFEGDLRIAGRKR